VKTRDRLRLRKRNVSYFDAMLNDALPRQERITLLSRLYSGMWSGGQADRTKARRKSLRAIRIEGLAPLRLDILELKVDLSDAYWDDSEKNVWVGGGESTSADAVAHQMWRRLTKPKGDDDLAREIAARSDLWPKRIPSRIWFRKFVAGVSDKEWNDPAPANETRSAR